MMIRQCYMTVVRYHRMYPLEHYKKWDFYIELNNSWGQITVYHRHKTRRDAKTTTAASTSTTTYSRPYLVHIFRQARRAY